MRGQTVLVPDGYNGHTVLMHAKPLEEWADGTVKLHCAVPGKGYIFFISEQRGTPDKGHC